RHCTSSPAPSNGTRVPTRHLHQHDRTLTSTSCLLPAGEDLQNLRQRLLCPLIPFLLGCGPERVAYHRERIVRDAQCARHLACRVHEWLRTDHCRRLAPPLHFDAV